MRELLTFATVIDGIGRLARGIGWDLNKVSNNANEPVGDSGGYRTGANADLNTASRVEYGYIADAIPGIRMYRVLPEGGGPMIACSLLMHGPCGMLGAYDATTLMSGTHVRYMRHRQQPMEGVILGVEPAYSIDPQLMYMDVISQGSNTGAHVETGYHDLLQMGGSTEDIKHNGGLTNYGGRSPWDSMEGGEFNYSTETGTMLHLDSYMGFLRADDVTGIWVFYWDGLVRVAGQQLEEVTSVSAREVYDDEGEVSVYRGVATYPWEQLGSPMGPTSNVTEYTAAGDIQDDRPYYGRVEPNPGDLQSFHRFQTYEGYLGQIEKKLAVRPSGASSYSYGSEAINWGLFDSQIAISGHYLVRSATGITIAKRPVIPVPKRMKLVTDGAGDGAGNYKASSYYDPNDASLPDHLVQPVPDYPSVDTGEQTLFTALSVLDQHAYMFNWEGLHPFYYHENDFYLPEESAYSHISTNQETPAWSYLKSYSGVWYLPPSTYTSLALDHRNGNTANIYKNTSFLSLLDDGTVVLGGGAGEEIRMAGGCIFLSAPGEVFMQAGRNIVAWGGRDVCLRAWNSVDITANGGDNTGTYPDDKGGDVRIKAEGNMQLLSNNSGGKHGMFLEHRGSGPSQYDFREQGEGVRHSGIIIMSCDQEVCVYGDSIYLRTCGPNDANNKNAGFAPNTTIPRRGDITLDATRGTPSCCGDITTRSNAVRHWVCCEIMHSFNDTGDHPYSQGVNIFNQYGETLCNDLFVNGAVVSYGDVLAGGNLLTPKEVYSHNGIISKLSDSAKTSLDTAVTAGHTYETSLIAWANARHVIDFDVMWYATGRPGHPETIYSMWTSLRADDDYHCSGFSLFENRWQQMARQAGTVPAYWTEHWVESNAPSVVTLPFPGGQYLMVAPAYKRYDPAFVDYNTHKAINRADGNYESPALNSLITSTINGYYPIVGR